MFDPTVSVILVTYNHAPYIREAFSGIVSQRTDFDYEILICEDCSTDGTREIVLELERTYPDRVRLFLSAINQNDNEVFTRAWRAAKGTYIAYLDGDDYWIDPLKLQKQVAFLRENPDVFICGHAVRQVDHTGKTIAESKFGIQDDQRLSRDALASGTGYPLPALSVLFRNNGQIPAAKTFNTVFNADTFMFAYFSNFGSGFISREIMGVHRVHPGSAWSLLDDRASADLRNATLRRIPSVIEPGLRAAAYAGLLRHSLHEDYRLARKLRDIPVSIVMRAFWNARRKIFQKS